MQVTDKPVYGDIKPNFILAGEDLIFEGRSFDMSDSPRAYIKKIQNEIRYIYIIVIGGELQILFLGDYMKSAPPKKLITMLESLLSYSLSLVKLQKKFKLYGERQIINTTSPGDKLYAILQMQPFAQYFDFNTSVIAF